MSAWMCFHLPSQTAEHNDFNPDMSAITTIGFFWRVTLNSTFSPLIGLLHTGPCLVFGGKIKMDGYKSEQKKTLFFSPLQFQNSSDAILPAVCIFVPIYTVKRCLIYNKRGHLVLVQFSPFKV